MKRMLPAVLLLLAQSMAWADGPEPTIGKDLQLYVDGKPYFVRGMAYAPEPRGFPLPPPALNGENRWSRPKGAWLCKVVNQYAPEDIRSPCEDDDLFGLLPATTQVNRDYNAALPKLWQRDLGMLQAMGVNTLRIYNANSPRFKNHIPFLNAVRDSGMRVIWPVLTHYLAVDHFDENVISDGLRETCPGGKLHPSILAYTVGNELIPVGQNADPAQKFRINKAIDIVRRMCPKALITYAHNDVPPQWTIQPNPQNGVSALMEALPGLDFLTVNVYRNDPNSGGIDGFPNLFDNDIQSFTRHYGKPVLLGEIGEHQNDRYQSTWFNRTWKYLLQNSARVGNLGAVYFEFNDEPLKKQVSGTSNDAYMGIVTANWPDARNMDALVDPPLIIKDASYTGIPTFDNGTDHVRFAGSDKGRGRYEMFVNKAEGIQACSFKASPSPDAIHANCLNAK